GRREDAERPLREIDPLIGRHLPHGEKDRGGDQDRDGDRSVDTQRVDQLLHGAVTMFTKVVPSSESCAVLVTSLEMRRSVPAAPTGRADPSTRSTPPDFTSGTQVVAPSVLR